jgi:hypothetical protein
MIDPVLDRRASLFRQFKLNRPTRFLLDDDRTILNSTTKTDIGHLQTDEIAPS